MSGSNINSLVQVTDRTAQVSVARSNGEWASPDVDQTLTPSLEACAELQFAYGYLNDALWDGILPPCMIVYMRKKHVLGHFAPDRFQHRDGIAVAELGLNPSYLAVRDDRASLSTLVHEMAHVWRHYLGPLNRNGKRVTNGYHDLKWAAEMERVGLTPSDTGAPGGKKTGYRMTHFIDEGGPFDVACRDLMDSGFRINWRDRIVRTNLDDEQVNDPDDKPAKKDRIKFSCPSCGLNAWAKPSASLACATCSLLLTPST